MLRAWRFARRAHGNCTALGPSHRRPAEQTPLRHTVPPMPQEPQQAISRRILHERKVGPPLPCDVPFIRLTQRWATRRSVQAVLRLQRPPIRTRDTLVKSGDPRCRRRTAARFRHAAGPLHLLQTPHEFRIRRVTPPAEPVAQPAMQPECPRPANDTLSATVMQASTAEACSPLQLPRR